VSTPVDWSQFTPLDPEPTGTVDWTKFAPLKPGEDTAVARPSEPSTLEVLGGAFRSGLESGKRAVTEMADRFLGGDEGTPVSDEVAQGLGYQNATEYERAQHAQRLSQSARRSQALETENTATREGQQALARADATGSYGQVLKAIFQHPQAAAQVTAQSLGMAAPGMAAASATGAAMPLVVGLNSAVTDYQSTLEDQLAAKGVDLTDPVAVRRALADKDMMAQTRQFADKHAIPVTLFDTLTAGLAGRLVAASRGGKLGAAGAVAAETLGQAGGGAAGEALGEYQSEGRVSSPLNVTMEAIGEMPSEAVEAPVGYREAMSEQANRRRSSSTSFDQPEISAIHADYQDLADTYGAKVTSRTRTPEHNREVGGVPNSQHIVGTAWDFVPPQSQWDAFKADAARRGYQVIDEGNHIHLELPGHHPLAQGTSANAPASPANTNEPDRLGRIEPTMRDPMQVANEMQTILEQATTSGQHAADRVMEDARKNRGMSPEGEAQTNESAAREPTAATTFTPAFTDQIERMKDDLLNQVTAQTERTITPETELAQAHEATDGMPPIRMPAPLDEAPQVATQAPPMQGAPQAQQIAPQAAPTPSAVPTPSQPEVGASGLPAPVAAGPQVLAPASPAPSPPSAPAPVPASPPPPSASPAPITQEPAASPERHPLDYDPASATNTARSEALRNSLNQVPGITRQLVGGKRQLGREHVQEVRFLNHDIQREADRFAKLIGRKAVFVRFNKVRATGLIQGTALDDKHLFINADAIRENGVRMTTVLGHEFLHTLRRGGNAGLEDVIAFARSRIDSNNPYVRRLMRQYKRAYGDKYTDEMLLEELIANEAGDMLSDPAFWEEMAQKDPSLFRRTLKKFIAFLHTIADRARKNGDDGAFREIEALRAKLKDVLAEHVAQMHEVNTQRAEVANSNIPAQASMSSDYEDQLARDYEERRRVKEGVATDKAAALLEAGKYQEANSAIEPFVHDHAPPFEARTPEARKFLAGSSEKVNPDLAGNKAKVRFHGTARDITAFKPKQGEAVFLASRASFSGPFAASSAHHIDNNEANDVIVGQHSMAEMKRTAPPGSIDWMLADLLMKARQKAGDSGAYLIPYTALDMVDDYTFEDAHGNVEAPEAYEVEELRQKLEGMDKLAQEHMGFIRKSAHSPTGMNVMPLIANVKTPFDFQDKAAVAKLMRNLKSAYPTIGEFNNESKASTVPVRYSSWEELEQKIKASDTNWETLESKPIVEALKELGHDSYFVSEMGHKNLAVFDPKNVKSATGNVGTFGQRAPTAEEAASLGMTLEEAQSAQDAGDIRLSLNSVLQNTLTAPIQATGEAATQFHRWVLDEFKDLKDIQQAIADSHFGGSLPQGYDAHRNENLRHGAFQDAARRAEERFIAPIARIVSKAGSNAEEFSDYLWWRHAPERDAYLRGKLDPSIAATVGPDELAGISPADAQRNIAALDPAKRAAFERAAKFIDGMRKFTLDTMLSNGLISQDYHDAVLRQYQHYVPLRGLPDGSEVVNRAQSGKGLSMTTKGLGPRAAGRKSKPNNIIEEMMRDMDGALVGTQKQRVLESLIRLIVVNPDPTLWEIQPVAAQRKWVNGVLTVVQTNGESADQLTFMHHGLPVKIEIRHAKLKEALLQLNGQPLPGFLRAVGRLTRWLSAVKTAFSPYFMLVNPVRDSAFAIMGVSAEHGMGAVHDMARLYPHVWGALKRDDNSLRVAPPTDPTARKVQQYTREFAAAGGKTGRVYVADIREQQVKLHRLLDRYAQSKGIKDIMAGNFASKDAFLLLRKGWQNVAHIVDTANDMAENSTRLTVYAAMRERGMSVEDAAQYAKEVTVNFNRRGRLAHFVGPFFMFFNASVQGGARVGKLMKNKKFMGTMGAMFATSYALALASMISAGDDDDGESRYLKAINDNTAQRYLPIYMGHGANALTLPVPYGPNVFTYLGWRLAKKTYNEMRGREDSAGGVAGDIASQAIMAFSPIDPGKGWGAFLPEFARIPYQVAKNQNDFGTPLNASANDDRSGQPAYLKTSAQTPDVYRYFARVLNEWSGGNGYDAGKVDLTGEQVRYVWQQYAGGMGRLAGESWGLVDDALSGVDPEPSDIPLANVYFRGKGEVGRNADSYYNNLDDYTKTVADWKLAIENEDTKKLDEIAQRAPWVQGAELDASTQEGRDAQAGTVMESARGIQSEMRKLRKEKNQVAAGLVPNADGTPMTRAQIKQRLRELDEQNAGLQQDFNYTLNSGRGYLGTPAPE
jgi:hypothetical protein